MRIEIAALFYLIDYYAAICLRHTNAKHINHRQYLFGICHVYSVHVHNQHFQSSHQNQIKTDNSHFQ